MAVSTPTLAIEVKISTMVVFGGSLFVFFDFDGRKASPDAANFFEPVDSRGHDPFEIRAVPMFEETS